MKNYELTTARLLDLDHHCTDDQALHFGRKVEREVLRRIADWIGQQRNGAEFAVAIRELVGLSNLTPLAEIEAQQGAAEALQLALTALESSKPTHDHYPEPRERHAKAIAAVREALRTQQPAPAAAASVIAWYTDWHPEGRKYAATPHGFNEMGAILDDPELIREVWHPLVEPSPTPQADSRVGERTARYCHCVSRHTATTTADCKRCGPGTAGSPQHGSKI